MKTTLLFITVFSVFSLSAQTSSQVGDYVSSNLKKLEKRFSLSESQKTLLTEVFSDYKTHMDSYKNEMIATGKSDYELNRGNREEIRTELTTQYREHRVKMRFEQMNKVYSILDEDQKAIYIKRIERYKGLHNL